MTMDTGTQIRLLALIFLVATATACSRSDRIIKVADLPNTPDFEVNTRQQYDLGAKPEKVHLDVGYLWSQNSLLDFPILNTDGRFVGYTGSDSRYIEFSKGELEDLTTKANIPMPQPPSIPFWDAWGGKLLLLVLIPPFVVISLLLDRLWRKISTGM